MAVTHLAARPTAVLSHHKGEASVPQRGSAERSTQAASVNDIQFHTTRNSMAGSLSTSEQSRICLGAIECQETTSLQWPLKTFARLYIFDWDNTLCPTDWLCDLHCRHGQSVYTATLPCVALCSPSVQSRLAAHESSVKRLLHKCTERGQVAVISNATTVGLLKTMRLLPVVQRTLTELSMLAACQMPGSSTSRGVVSARDMCEPHGLPLEKWKDNALIRLVTSFIHKHPQQRHSIMTIGDQEFEHIALHKAAAHLSLKRGCDCHPKCIKFVESPSIETLTRQILSFTELLDRFADDDSGTYWMEVNHSISEP
ncbi:hypothetical protein Efla_002512 [Eimeria flavescens]